MTSLPPQENQNNEVVEDLAKSLQATTALMQSLLAEIQDNATTLAVLREKFDTLGEKVQSLSKLVRGDDGDKSVVIRLALIERTIADIEKEIRDIRDESDNNHRQLHTRISSVKDMVYRDVKLDSKLEKVKVINTLKLIAIIAPGALALGMVILKYFLGE